ncbi:rod shape-determining protein MreC [Bailinhaonella thermotolerans]|uniref:Cell shape-determining protein MreC n=1 Tax=Bailinhaonella thermotolerans TaxID=1070861 RepID=A0A3A4BTA0_9ACTN|nr:rod shape-determining protein MreC [Bailinhaonella thermotolerans]RJL34536.1 rod shape-determining protein MreC [Bailinhaonella thermotolerans]
MRDTRRSRVALGVLLGFSLLLLTVDHRGGPDSPLGPVRAAAASFFGSMEYAVAAVVAPVGAAVDVAREAPVAKRRIRDLEEENVALRRMLAANRQALVRYGSMEKLLRTAALGEYKIVPGQVIARRGQPGFEDTVEIDAGARDGIKRDMTVMNGDGLVGRVVRVSPATSTVVLITDPGSAAGVRLETSREIGVVHGLGKGRAVMRFQLLDSNAHLAPGTRIVSFGSESNRPYVPGLPVGVIERVEQTPGELTRTAYARPYVRFSSIDVVGVVVQAPPREARTAVSPGRPPVRPTAEQRGR